MDTTSHEQPEQTQQTRITPKEQRRIARDLEVAHAVRKRTIRKIIKITIIVVLVVVGGILAWLGTRHVQKSIVLGPDYSKEYKDTDEKTARMHIQEGQKSPVDYLSNPPTSGPHWPDPVREGVYNRPQPDEGLIHTLEHGRVWISYKSSIPQSAKDALNKIALSEPLVIITVRDQDPNDIALAAWERLDTFDLDQNKTFDEKRVRDFIARYRNKGPEQVPAMTGKVYD